MSIGLLPGMPFIPFFTIGLIISAGAIWSIKIQEAEELKIQEAEEAEIEEQVDEPVQIEDLVHPDSFEIRTRKKMAVPKNEIDDHLKKKQCPSQEAACSDSCIWKWWGVGITV